jgi:two-component system, OmpR family, sensor histidine kinase KdpD
MYSIKLTTSKQYLFSLSSILLISLLCYITRDFIDYKIVAFILLVSVSLLAMFLEILPTLLAAVLSALVWNYFFIQPYYTFHIGNTEDALMFLMYFLIALINAVLTYKIRQIERLASQNEAKLKSFELYNTLLDSLSHEFRTPISAIIGSTDALQNNTSISESQKIKLINEISIASIRLNNQVENLLNMSRIESGVVVAKRDWEDVTEMVYEVIRSLKHKSFSQEIKVVIPENFPLVKLDYGLTEQVLYNLLNNAIIYTPDKSTITVLLSYDDTNLYIEILDEGKGFPKDEIDFVFDKFYRLKNSKTGGSGLGLSIVKGFVEAQNGKIRLENRREKGSKFTIKINTEISNFNALDHE